MSCYKLLLIILVIFFKTGNVLSLDNVFNVNNVEITKKLNDSNVVLADRAIKKGFSQLLKKILLSKDIAKLSQLKFNDIKDLLLYYQISEDTQDGKEDKVYFNIFFDKAKLHSLFFERNISYSEIVDKDLYLLPILLKENQVYIYSNNYFYNKWNEIYKSEQIEFILPIENIEIIEHINSNKNNLYDIDLNKLFKEYVNKNLALVIIEESNLSENKIYLRTRILNKNIDKNLKIKKLNGDKKEFYIEIINQTAENLINMIKSQNLIDIRTPSFLNARLILNKKNNLVELNNILKNIEAIDGIFVQEFNNNYVLLKLRYLGKLDKIIDQLRQQKIKLELINDQWSLKIIK